MYWGFILILTFFFSMFFAVAITVVLLYFLKRSTADSSNYVQILVLLVGVAAIGACAGMSGGMSRVGVVGAIIPAMFTLLGGLAVYLFGVDNSRGVIASITGACFAISLFISYAQGSQLRNTGDEYRDLRNHCAMAYRNHEIIGNPEALKEFESRYKKWCDSAKGWNLGQNRK